MPTPSLKELREQLKLSKERVAAELDISSQTVTNWETNRVPAIKMSVENLIDLAKLYDMKIEKMVNLLLIHHSLPL